MSVVHNIAGYKQLLIKITDFIISGNIYGNKGDNNDLIIHFDETASDSFNKNNLSTIKNIVRLYSYNPTTVKFKFNSYKEIYTVDEKWIVFHFLIRPFIIKINKVSMYRYDKRIFESIFTKKDTPIIFTKKQAKFLIKYYGVDNILSILSPQLDACSYLLTEQKLHFEKNYKEFINWFESAAIFEQDLIDPRSIIDLSNLN